MTVISPRSTTAYVPKPVQAEPSAPALVANAQDAGKTAGQLREERAEADALKQIERVQTIVDLMQEASKKMTAERIKKFSEDQLKQYEEMLSKPAEEPEEITGDKAQANVLKLRDQEFAAAGVAVTPGLTGFTSEGWLYEFLKDGRMTRRRSGVLTPDQVDPARQRVATLRGNLLSGVYDSQIEQSQRRVDELFGKLGTLTERERDFLNGFGSLTSGGFSLTV